MTTVLDNGICNGRQQSEGTELVTSTTFLAWRAMSGVTTTAGGRTGIFRRLQGLDEPLLGDVQGFRADESDGENAPQLRTKSGHGTVHTLMSGSASSAGEGRGTMLAPSVKYAG